MRRSARSTASPTPPGSAPRSMPGSTSSARFMRPRPTWRAVPRDREDRRGAGRGPVAFRSVQGIERATRRRRFRVPVPLTVGRPDTSERDAWVPVFLTALAKMEIR